MAGYLRTSTEDQTNGLEAQRGQIRHYAKGRGIRVEWFEEHASAKDLQRPALAAALERLADPGNELGGLVVAKLDRLSRSLHDLTGLFRLALDQGWALVSLAPAVDMTSPYGRAMAQMAGVFAELERELCAQRTREALGQLDLVVMDRELQDRICALSAGGLSSNQIGKLLEREGVPNPQGGPRWHRSTVWRALRRAEQRAGEPPRRRPAPKPRRPRLTDLEIALAAEGDRLTDLEVAPVLPAPALLDDDDDDDGDGCPFGGRHVPKLLNERECARCGLLIQ